MNGLLIASLLSVTIRAGTSLLYVTIGEIFTEKSGVTNLGLEGMMIMGAVSGFAAAFHSHNAWVGLLVAILSGGLLAFIHTFLTISLKANETLSGLTLTLFGSGLASFLGQKLGPQGKPLVGLVGPRLGRVIIPGLVNLPVLGRAFFYQDALVYLGYVLIPLSWLVLYQTVPGLRLRACGESPEATAVVGIKVSRIRYLCTILGGMLAGLGGAHLSLSYTPGWTENLTGGRGWIAVALVVFSGRDPVKVWLGAMLFGGVNAVQLRLQAAGTNIPASFLHMLPYLSCVVTLVIVSWTKKIERGRKLKQLKK